MFASINNIDVELERKIWVILNLYQLLFLHL